MDGSRFDSLTRSFAQSGSRRRLLGGMIAGTLGLIGLNEAVAAECRTDGRTCRENANCCSGYCSPPGDRHRRLCGPAPSATTTPGPTSTTTSTTTTIGPTSTTTTTEQIP
jgi:hypothetical protein